MKIIYCRKHISILLFAYKLNKNVWIVLNSWGESWASYGGFFYLERLDSSSDVGTCGIASMASFPTDISLDNSNENIAIE